LGGLHFLGAYNAPIGGALVHNGCLSCNIMKITKGIEMKLGFYIDGSEKKAILLPCVFVELFPLNHYIFHNGCLSRSYLGKY